MTDHAEEPDMQEPASPPTVHMPGAASHVEHHGFASDAAQQLPPPPGSWTQWYSSSLHASVQAQITTASSVPATISPMAMDPQPFVQVAMPNSAGLHAMPSAVRQHGAMS